MESDQKNIFIAFILSLLLVIGMNRFFGADVPVVTEEAVVQTEKADKTADKKSDKLPADKLLNVETFSYENEYVKGTVSSVASRFADVELKKYKQSVKKGSPAVELLNPKDKASALWTYRINQRLDTLGVWTKVPSDKSDKLILERMTDEQVLIRRIVTIDDAYMVTIHDEMTNLSDKNVAVSSEGQLSRSSNQQVQTSTVHEGFVGVLNHSLKEEKYKDIKDQGEIFKIKNPNGWFGFSDKYWLTVLAFEEKEGTASFAYQGDLYQASFIGREFNLAPNDKKEITAHLFVGPKEIELLTRYQKEYNIDKFELGIDFGWYYFITKPFLFLLEWINGFVGNMGVAILIFALIIRLLMFPIAQKSFVSMAKMRQVQPKIKEIQDAYKDDKMRMNQEMLLLYQREKINPASGCLPMLIQIPIFFSLYKVLSVSIQMRQAKFFGWIKDLSAPDPSSVFTLGGLIPLPLPTFLDIGIWPLLMGITMWVQQKMNPAPSTKEQGDVLKWLPFLFMFMFGRMASGLVIYWTWSNILSMLQQAYIMKKYGTPDK